MIEVRLIDEAALINEAETGNWDTDIKELKMILKYAPTIDAVNENLPAVIESFGGKDTRKIVATWYIDDRAIMPKDFSGAAIQEVTEKMSNSSCKICGQCNSYPCRTLYDKYCIFCEHNLTEYHNPICTVCQNGLQMTKFKKIKQKGMDGFNEFTDRIRMEIVPELEERLKQTLKAIRKNDAFTRDYKAGVKDNLLCGVTILNAILDDFDVAEKSLEDL